MRHLVSLLAFVSALAGAHALTVPRLGAQGQIVFRATYTQEAYPDLGWGAAELKHAGRFWQRAFLPGGGPQGQHAVRHSWIAGQAGQFNLGNRAAINRDVPADGSRFYRWRMKVEGDNCGGGWTGGGRDCATMTNKLLIVGQDCGRDCRFILTYETERNGIRNFRIQKDGGADLADTGAYANGRWLDIQVELITSTSPTGGGYKLWVNSNDYGRPTAQRLRIALTNANHVYTWFGGFSNDGLSDTGSHRYDHTDFEIGTAFDPAWDR